MDRKDVARGELGHSCRAGAVARPDRGTSVAMWVHPRRVMPSPAGVTSLEWSMTSDDPQEES